MLSRRITIMGMKLTRVPYRGWEDFLEGHPGEEFLEKLVVFSPSVIKAVNHTAEVRYHEMQDSRRHLVDEKGDVMPPAFDKYLPLRVGQRAQVRGTILS